MLSQAQKWREAHPSLFVVDEALKQAGPFPSLSASDYLVFLESKGVDPEIVRFVKDMQRELIWVYDNWKRADLQAKPADLLNDLLASFNSTIPEYSALCNMVRDYRKSHNIDPDPAENLPEWARQAMETQVPIEVM